MNLEHALFQIADKNRRVFRELADAYRAGVKPSAKTLRDFQRIEAVEALFKLYTPGEVARATTNVLKDMLIEAQQES